MSNRIVCESLTKRYGNVAALNGLDLNIDVTEPTGLVGANGAGKSTLFAILCGFVRPTVGTVEVLGNNTQHSALKGKVGILPQDTSMYAGLSVQTQLSHYVRLHGLSSRNARLEVDKVLEQVGATRLARQFPETLSFGQRKKVFLAQAMIGSPQLILLDEPTSGLDPVAAHDIQLLLQQLSQRYSLLISSHNISEIEDLCRNIVILNKGKVSKTGTIRDFKRMHQCFRVRLDSTLDEAAVEAITALASVSAVEQEQSDPRRMIVFYQENNANQAQLEVLAELQKRGLGVEELSKGTALADEISSLLQS